MALSNSNSNCREYNLGEGPEPFVQEVAQEEGLALPADFQARQMKPETDIVAFDMVLVMDKFTAADVLREVSSSFHVTSRHYEPHTVADISAVLPHSGRARC